MARAAGRELPARGRQVIQWAMNAANEISLDDLRRRMGRPGFVLVDVLPHVSFVDGHIPTAVSLPVADIRARATIVLPDRKVDVVVYCGGPT
jgi:rhodanese-related sulfurtransferase